MRSIPDRRNSVIVTLQQIQILREHQNHLKPLAETPFPDVDALIEADVQFHTEMTEKSLQK